jgi:hypothetical protein
MAFIMALFGFVAFILCVGVVLALFGHRMSAMAAAVLAGTASFEIALSFWGWGAFASSAFGVALGCSVGVALFLALSTPGERRAFFAIRAMRPVHARPLVPDELRP